MSGTYVTARNSDTDTSGILWEIAPQDNSSSLLKISGDLRPGWLGRLSSYMAIERINIIRANAWKCGLLCWEASFEIDKGQRPIDTSSGFNPLQALKAANNHSGIQPLAISKVKIERSKRHGGSIYTEIAGKDCVGFLYSILAIFSLSSLFPTELEISTKFHTVLDQFWLKGIGFSAPSDEDMTSLQERLDRLRQ